MLRPDEVRKLVGHDISGDVWKWPDVCKVMKEVQKRTREEVKVELAERIVALLGRPR